MTSTTNLTDPDLYLGTVVAVTAAGVSINLPFAAAASMRRVQGRRRLGGIVGDFVCIDAEGWVLVARLDEVRLPERDRAMVDPRRRNEAGDPHPIGRVAVLAAVHVATNRVVAGTERPPRLGARVYLAPYDVIELASHTISGGSGEGAIVLGMQPNAHGVEVRLSPEAVFDRHCAVIGSTGGGKSWTTARLVEEIGRQRGKVLLLDPTGEYRPPTAITRTIRLGVTDASSSVEADDVRFPYWTMTTDDLFALFTPAGQMHGPLLREALVSLKLLAALGADLPDGITVAEDGTLMKAKQKKRPFVEAIRSQRATVERDRGAYFDITLLVSQLRNECVWPTDFEDATIWGGRDDRSVGMLVSLVLRVESFLADGRFGCVFRCQQSDYSLATAIDEFMADGSLHVLHLDVSTLPTERHFKQIVVNALARILLERARGGGFKKRPLILAVDEAHQFLGRVAHLDDFGSGLDAIEVIAKEGRKYGLHLVVATQRPRDLTRGVLSQVGCSLVHRLTESEDLEMLRHTTGRRDSGALDYVPTLEPGHCLVYGSALAFPIIVAVHRPSPEPDSSGTDFLAAWRDAD